jgi:mono/diheme cytochrome c family protein
MWKPLDFLPIDRSAANQFFAFVLRRQFRRQWGNWPGGALVALVVWLLACSGNTGANAADRGGTPDTAVSRGFTFLTEKPYLPADFDQETFEAIWQSWPEPLRSQARNATVAQRRAMAFQRYGLTPLPGSDGQTPLQYVVREDGGWTMNCFSCHGGTVYGKPFPGAPNSQFALQTLTEEIRGTKFRLGKSMTRMDIGSMIMPLGSTVGRTNAVMFGVGLMHFRNPDLSIRNDVDSPEFTHHDMDAPPWWNFHRRPSLYIDGFAQRGHRGLMQFMLVKENGPEKFRQWEQDFKDVYEYMMSLRPPKYEGPIDADLANLGRQYFNETCARCHGTYGDESEYPNVRVPLSELGTDPVRLAALPVEGREKYAASWFAQAGDGQPQQTVTDPDGYVAPPLDGVWASPPYFHNGSVPTLWHVLNADDRPVVWRRKATEIDPERIGFQIEVVDSVPWDNPDPHGRRQYMDTRRFGKSAKGHDFGLELTPRERNAVLEYLKTL